jgi:hypothetical protein
MVKRLKGPVDVRSEQSDDGKNFMLKATVLTSALVVEYQNDLVTFVPGATGMQSDRAPGVPDASLVSFKLAKPVWAVLVSRAIVPAETFTVQLHGFPPQSTSKLGFSAMFPACAEGASPSATIAASAPIPGNGHRCRRVLIGITWIFMSTPPPQP